MSLSLIQPPPEPSFQTRLRLERIEDTSRDGRGTWQLLAPLVYVSRVADRVFTIPEGFVTDLASVPRIPLAFWLTGGIGHAAAVVHDWLYTSHAVPRTVADAVFREALTVLGVPSWRTWLMWTGVRVGGGGSWDAPGPRQEPVVQVALARARPVPAEEAV